MTDMIRRFQRAPHQADTKVNPFRLLPNVQITPPSAPPPKVTIEGVPPIPQRREIQRNET